MRAKVRNLNEIKFIACNEYTMEWNVHYKDGSTKTFDLYTFPKQYINGKYRKSTTSDPKYYFLTLED